MHTSTSRERNPIWLAVAIVLVAAMMRLLPHPDNVTPLVALALVGGSLFTGWLAVAAPLAAIIVSDLALGFHATIPFTWGSVALISLLGLWAGKRATWGRMLGAGLAGSTLFYLITNFGVWWMGHGQWYPRTVAGLLDCYIAALPFFRASLLGDLAYVAVLFGAYRLAVARLQRPDSCDLAADR